MGIRASLLLLALCLLTGCGRDNPRASIIPVYDLKMQGRSTGAAIIDQGDTLGGIANRYALTLDDIIRANMLGGGNLVQPNQRIMLPPPRSYTVKAGDTFDRVARMFDTTPAALASANNMYAPYTIREGQVLRIVQSRAAMQKGFITERPRPPVAITAEPLTPNTKAKTKKHKAAYIMPVKGKIISGYGPKAGGLYNDGINIAAKAGTPVHAAAGGTVVYAGEGPEGFGQLVMVRHDNGYFTVYSHLSRISTTKGSSLGQGDTLGHVGATGKVKDPQLHFEIRNGTDAVNPQGLL
jgi:murein DD-endopeptidase MepM/ murein hydrolase activator NlpD